MKKDTFIQAVAIQDELKAIYEDLKALADVENAYEVGFKKDNVLITFRNVDEKTKKDAWEMVHDDLIRRKENALRRF
ncbi:hypothetical protein [Holdemanella porci]|uniref:hypothetical protein n=1 Tax=Holdemanella porci TaxID=2652276 RepID=UPI003AB534B7